MRLADAHFRRRANIYINPRIDHNLCVCAEAFACVTFRNDVELPSIRQLKHRDFLFFFCLLDLPMDTMMTIESSLYPIPLSDCSVWVHGSWAPICGQTTATYLLMQFKQYLQIVLMNSRTRTRKLNSVRANTMAPMLALALPAMMRSAATPANVICVNFAKSIKAKMTVTMARWAPTRAIVIVNSKISRTKAHERKSVG